MPPGEERYAATLDGADRYGHPLSLAELAAGGVFGLLVTGSAAVSVTGVRFGKGHGYFDLEWAMLSELGLIDGRTEVVALVHDCQVVEEPLPAQPHDVVVDRIVTPTRTVDVDHPPRPPGRIRWDALRGGELKDLGVVAQLEAAAPSRPRLTTRKPAMSFRISGRRFAAGALGTAAAALVGPGRARAASPFAFQASWINDAEFTGYFVAIDKG